MMRILKSLLPLAMALPCLNATAQHIDRYEYWIDHGVDQRLSESAVTSEFVIDLSTDTLSAGVHTLTFRARDSHGQWTLPFCQYFLKMPPRSQSQAAATLTQYEYWIDQQHQHRVSLAATADGIVTFDLQTDTLSQGVHTLTFRAQDSRGQWSHPYCQYFLKMPPRSQSQAAATLTQYEYWIDQQHQHRVSLAATADGIVTFDLQTDTLSQGVHTLTFRAQDSRGQWSHPYCQYFLKMPQTVASVERLITAYRYWFNEAAEDAVTVAFDKPASPQLLDVDLKPNNLLNEVTKDNITIVTTDDDQQQLAVRNILNTQFRDSQGQWSQVQRDTFAVAVGDRVMNLTAIIANPEANQSWTGWTIEGNRDRSVQKYSPWNNDGTNNYFCLHDKSSNGWHAQMKQTVKGLPAGTYYLSAIGRTATNTVMSLSANGYSVSFPANDAIGGELWAEADENSPIRQANNGKGTGWNKREVSFVTDGEPFDIVVDIIATGYDQWADIDAFTLSMNGIMDNGNIVRLTDLQLADAPPAAWGTADKPVTLAVTGHYANKRNRDGNIYYSVDGGNVKLLKDGLTAGSSFEALAECQFRSTASPHKLVFYGKDSEGVVSALETIEIGNMTRACRVDGLPEVAIYTGSKLEADGFSVRDTKTGNTLEADKYTYNYIDNVNEGTAHLVIEGVYPYYMGSVEAAFPIRSYLNSDDVARLRKFYEQTAGESHWNRKWSIESGQVRSDQLWGVTGYNTRVTALNLERNRLTGLLDVTSIPTAVKELRLANNRISSLSGVIPATVEVLTLGGQQIEETYALTLNEAGLEKIESSVPNLCFYDHQHQSFERPSTFDLMVGSSNAPVIGHIAKADRNWTLTPAQGYSVYRQPSGSTVYCKDDQGNVFGLALDWMDGDANFDAAVNVLDLSALMMYVHRSYGRTFNFNAANLWDDDVINVQDAVCLVNKLLDKDEVDTQNGSRASRRAKVSETDAVLVCTDNELKLLTSVPVSAFDIVLQGVQLDEVVPHLDTFSFALSIKQQKDGVRIIGYALGRELIPECETVLMSLKGQNAHVKAALLADGQAKAVNVSAAGATVIDTLSNKTVVGEAIYDLQGLKVPDGSKKSGVYINRGKKKLVK